MAADVLVIDDERAVRDAFELALLDENYNVRLAEDGERGIAMAAETRPDAVFLDLKMPGIDGVQTMRRLLEADPTLHIYIVTAFQLEFMQQLSEARKAGCRFEVAAKPLSAEQIRAIARIATAA